MDPRAWQRASQAVRCLPFRVAFYRELESEALSSSQLAARGDWERLVRRRLKPGRVEDHFIWLIQLGVLRREVDGQGLTERVRLTPLGRELLNAQGAELAPAGALLQLHHWLRRHRPRW